jgi:DedD protein
LSKLLSGFAVQAGVFSDPRRAEELQAKLLQEGIPSSIEARVEVGPFKTRAEAQAAREKMKALGIDTVLLLPKGTKR